MSNKVHYFARFQRKFPNLELLKTYPLIVYCPFKNAPAARRFIGDHSDQAFRLLVSSIGYYKVA